MAVIPSGTIKDLASTTLKAIRAGLRGNVATLFPDRGGRYISSGLFPAEE